MLTISPLEKYAWFNFEGTFAVTHTSFDGSDLGGKNVELMTRGKYHVAGGLTSPDDHACVRLMYRTTIANKLTYGKLYALEGFLVGAKQHEMPFLLIDVDGKREVPNTFAFQETRIESLGLVEGCIDPEINPEPQGMLSVIVKHDGIDENDPHDGAMVVEYVIPRNLFSGRATEVFTAGRRVLFRGTLAGWNRDRDMVRVKVSSGTLDRGNGKTPHLKARD
ncbi:hypothetical protein PtA15_11A226 [Puccinia triticina]|uniref:Uncharacterized protein n=1 Tax=Puccinia triticina TaxID=208348 RepID=A0ABY7CZW4_9BASI|nr:uncharacterized protein PtA15_11A226 [Puccinia triticina]WAQ89537.1 hypothetical protein PtA15_11A226 [Puccinia triticina]